MLDTAHFCLELLLCPLRMPIGARYATARVLVIALVWKLASIC